MTYLRDFPNNALAYQEVPATRTSTLTGSSCDFLHGDGQCTAIQQVGTVTGTDPTCAGKIQESDDESTWSNISGATFTTVTGSTNLQSISFRRSKRYLRYVATIGGTSPSFPLAALIFEQKKQI